jgi:hypothetical protein
MTQEAAEKFAKALLLQFGKDRVFQFELPEGHNLEYVAAAFERAGCKVLVNELRNSVTVEVPEGSIPT